MKRHSLTGGVPHMPYRLAVILLAACITSQSVVSAQGDFLFLRFEQYLEALIEQARIPGLSGTIVQDDRVIWERGFGYQDLERGIRAVPDTPYHIAGLTQIVTAALVLRCVEEGGVDLESPVSSFGMAFPEAGATVRQVLTHTTTRSPGEFFAYDPPRYDALGRVTEACSDSSFRTALAHNVLDRFGMMESVPGQDLEDPQVAAGSGLDPEAVERYQRVLARLARPYRLGKNDRPLISAYSSRQISGSTGLVSTVRDLARFQLALASGALVTQNTLDVSWRNPRSSGGVMLPHGFGWFVQTYNGQRVAWQYGICPEACSSFMLTIPERRLTMILLANSDGLVSPFRLSAGDVTTSLFAKLFLRLFS
jgi:CubicO group peptidase (beta-lactamase class C family)